MRGLKPMHRVGRPTRQIARKREARGQTREKADAVVRDEKSPGLIFSGVIRAGPSMRNALYCTEYMVVYGGVRLLVARASTLRLRLATQAPPFGLYRDFAHKPSSQLTKSHFDNHTALIINDLC